MENVYNVRIAGYAPFYWTDNPILAIRMTRMLLDAGYSKATLMKAGKSLLPIWEEDFEKVMSEYYHDTFPEDLESVLHI